MSEFLPNNQRGPESQDLSEETAFAMLDILESVAVEIKERIDRLKDSRPDINSDEELINNYALAMAEIEGSARIIYELRKYIAEQFTEQ